MSYGSKNFAFLILAIGKLERRSTLIYAFGDPMTKPDVEDEPYKLFLEWYKGRALAAGVGDAFVAGYAAAEQHWRGKQREDDGLTVQRVMRHRLNEGYADDVPLCELIIRRITERSNDEHGE